MKKVAPNFVGIGAAYAGLGVVAEMLAEHPAIANHIRAHNFFNTDRYEKKGKTWYETELLRDAGAGTLLGDVTAGYMSSHMAADRIAADYPDAKLFVILRHPLRRAVVEFASLQKIDSTAAKHQAATYLSEHPEVQKHSFYGSLLQSFFGYYSPIQLHVILYEELVEDPLKEISRLYDFLEVDKNFIPKRLRPFAPPPEDPKNPSLFYRAKKLIKKLYKKMFVKAPEPVFPAEIILNQWLTEEQIEIFNKAFAVDSDQLSFLLHRDMSEFWSLKKEPLPVAV